MLADLGLTVARQIPLDTVAGLLSRTYSLHGGVVRDGAGRIVSHLVTSGANGAMAGLFPVAGALVNGLQAGQLWKIGQDVAAVQRTVDTVLTVASVGTALSGLGLITSMAGFAFLNHRLKQVDSRLAELTKDVKAIRLSQEGLHKSELQAAVDSARHAEDAADESVRKALLIDSKREFNKLTHHYRLQWQRCQSVPEIESVNELYTLAILGYAMVCSDLGLRDAAALDLHKNIQEWVGLARGHAKAMLLDNHPERLLAGDYVDALPAQALVDLLDFAHGQSRGIAWIDDLRLAASRHGTLIGSLTSQAPDGLRRRLVKREPEGAMALAKSLQARAELLDANAAHYAFLQHKQLSAREFQLRLNAARHHEGAEAICIFAAPQPAG